VLVELTLSAHIMTHHQGGGAISLKLPLTFQIQAKKEGVLTLRMASAMKLWLYFGWFVGEWKHFNKGSSLFEHRQPILRQIGMDVECDVGSRWGESGR